MASTIRLRYSCTLHLCQRSRQASGSCHRLKKNNNLKPAFPIESSRGTSQISTAGQPEAPATGTNQFSCSERTLSPPSVSEVEGTSTQGRRSGDPVHPVEAPPLPDHQQVTTSPPNPEQEAGEVTPSDADIPESIARALRDALQEKWTGNPFPATMISLARVECPQLQQCLVTEGSYQV